MFRYASAGFNFFVQAMNVFRQYGRPRGSRDSKKRVYKKASEQCTTNVTHSRTEINPITPALNAEENTVEFSKEENFADPFHDDWLNW